MVAIPVSIDDVTASWLAEATGLPITGISVEQIGAGVGVIGAVYCVTLEGDGCPASVVVKLQGLDEAAVFTGSILRMYIREVKFYDLMASRAPVRVPRSLFTALDEATSAFVVVMEDMGALRIVDQVAGMDLTDARQRGLVECMNERFARAVDELGLHDLLSTGPTARCASASAGPQR